MYLTNPQKDLKSRKGNEPFSGTALEMEFLGSIDARKPSSIAILALRFLFRSFALRLALYALQSRSYAMLYACLPEAGALHNA
jgi:hypothetical protein